MWGLKQRARWVLAGLLVCTGSAWADSTAVLETFPETGAFSAHYREDRGAVSVIDFAGNYNKTVNSRDNLEPRAVVAREFFRTHADNYDFLVVFTTFEFNSGDAAAFHLGLQNHIKGIGLPQYDHSTLFGSKGRLGGYIDMAALSRWVMDPLRPEFERVLAVMGHEMLHQWSGNVRFDQGQGPETALLGDDDSHWSDLLDTNASVLYGHKWRDNHDGTFTSEGFRKFLSPLDLYLAGLYRADEVPPMTLIVNPALDPRVTPEQGLLVHGTTISGTARTISIQDIITAEGERIPAAADSQKNFRLGFILLTPADQEVSESQIAGIEAVRRSFTERFAIWTGGRGTAEAFPEALPEFSTGTPGTIGGGDLRVDPLSLAQGFAWLRGRQQTEGFWRDKTTTVMRDTAVSLDVLSRFDSAFVRKSDALNWLGTQQTANVDYLARQARILAAGGRATEAAALRAQLLALRNGDGGWGLNAGFASDPLDSALAVLALAGQPDAPVTTVSAAADYLAAQRNSDGGWGNRPDSPSRTSVTATVVRALHAAGRDVAPLTVSFLAGRQNPDGGFGDSPSTAHDTANVLQVLMELDALASVRTADASNYLYTRQTVDGSWEGSTYATASVLAALQRFNLPNWALESLELQPAAPIDGDRVNVTARVLNDTA
ncbi:MAG TPA: prenyltransferase/squalene oxidase repeat-containing protein, partial [Gammaproteobacteria bacterium]|nr:prenyltransferase/squalene oxidase repeat-containing protein [Gammaproteobacteria bacterium]